MDERKFFKSRGNKLKDLHTINEAENENSFCNTIEKNIINRKSNDIGSMPWRTHEHIDNIEQKDTLVIDSIPKSLIEPIKSRYAGAISNIWDKENERLIIQFDTPKRAKENYIELSEFLSKKKIPSHVSLYDSSIFKKKRTLDKKYSDLDIPTPKLNNVYRIIDVLFNW